MARRIDIGTASQIQSGKLVTLPVSITNNGVPESSFEYVFPAEQFSAAYDTINVMYGTMHLGCCHALSISNADFQEFYYAGSPVANPVALIGLVVQDVGTYAFV